MSSELVQKNYAAGNLTIKNRFVRNPNRYYQEDFFDTLPIMETIPVVTLNKDSNANDTANSAAYSHTRITIIKTTSTNLNANSVTTTYTFFNNLITGNSSVILKLLEADDTNFSSLKVVIGTCTYASLQCVENVSQPLFK